MSPANTGAWSCARSSGAKRRKRCSQSAISGDLTNAILKFQNAHDNVNVRLVYDTDNALDGLLTKSAQWDILILNSHYDAQILRPILNRGWALPIQSESVRAFVSGALPGVSAPLMQNGEVLGVPLDVDCYSAGVNVGCLNAMNLSIEDIPANWVDLLEYIQSLISDGDCSARGLAEQCGRSARGSAAGDSGEL